MYISYTHLFLFSRLIDVWNKYIKKKKAFVDFFKKKQCTPCRINQFTPCFLHLHPVPHRTWSTFQACVTCEGCANLIFFLYCCVVKHARWMDSSYSCSHQSRDLHYVDAKKSVQPKNTCSFRIDLKTKDLCNTSIFNLERSSTYLRLLDTLSNVQGWHTLSWRSAPLARW